MAPLPPSLRTRVPSRRGRRSRRVVVATALLALVAALLGATTVGVPATGATPSAGPGRLLTSAPFTARVLPLIPFGARAWRLRYSSTLQDGRSVEVTGSLLVPISPWSGPGPRPVVGYAVGTQGLADRCAASTQLEAGTEYENYFINLMLARGWAIAITDYPGLGTTGDHTFVVGRANGRAVLDSVRAARQVPGTGLAPDGPVLHYGYSEGGNASGWALQLAPTYAPELDVVAGAVGAPPADLLAMWTALDGSPFAFLLLYTGIGFQAAHPDLSLDPFLNPLGQWAKDLLRGTCLPDAILLGLLLPKQASAYLQRPIITDPAWRKALVDESLGTVVPRVPVFLGAARQDEAIPFAQAAGLRDRWCARGARVSFLDVPLGEHVTGAVSFSSPAIGFLGDRLAERLAGRPVTAPGAC